MDQLIAALLVALAFVSGLVAMIEPVMEILRVVWKYLREVVKNQK